MLPFLTENHHKLQKEHVLLVRFFIFKSTDFNKKISNSSPHKSQYHKLLTHSDRPKSKKHCKIHLAFKFSLLALDSHKDMFNIEQIIS